MKVQFTVPSSYVMTPAQYAKGLERFKLARTGLNAYMHVLAVAGIQHAAQFGACQGLNGFYASLNVNDQTALKSWLKESSTSVRGEGDDAEEVTWLGHNKEKGFHCKSGPAFATARADFIETKAADILFGNKPFFMKDVAKKDMVVIDAAWLAKELAKLIDKQEKGDVAPDPKKGGGQKVIAIDAAILDGLRKVQQAAEMASVVSNTVQ